jgi:dolichol kinase
MKLSFTKIKNLQWFKKSINFVTDFLDSSYQHLLSKESDKKAANSNKKSSGKAKKNNSSHFSFKQEIYRKINHLLIAILPISYFFLDKKILLYFLVPVCFFIIITDYYRHKFEIIAKIFNVIFVKILRDHESKKLTGASYFAMAALLIFSFFPKEIAINAFLILAISDALAAIIGKKIKSRPFFEKSLAGSLAFGVSALFITTIVALIFSVNFIYYLFALPAIYATTLVEARPKLLNMDDNFTIPVTFSVVLLIFNMIWV